MWSSGVYQGTEWVKETLLVLMGASWLETEGENTVVVVD